VEQIPFRSAPGLGLALGAVLSRLRQPTPGWLLRYSERDGFPREAFFASRVVYYPGAGFDGHPLKVFGGACVASCFIFADYGFVRTVTADTIEEHFRDEHHRQHPRGYRPICVMRLRERDLAPFGWTPHVRLDMRRPGGMRAAVPFGGPFAIFGVFERKEGFGEEHGADRLAILYVGGDGIATFDALFCQDIRQPPPFAVLLQDHGFGGNWTHFGGEGLLWELARAHARPDWLLVGRNTAPWPGYERVSTATGPAGMNRMIRFLCRWRGNRSGGAACGSLARP